MTGSIVDRHGVGAREVRRGRPLVGAAALGLFATVVAGCLGSGGREPAGPGIAAPTVDPFPATSASGAASSPSADPSPGRIVDLEGAGLPTLLPEAVRKRVPTRVRVPDLAIDLPVVAPPSDPRHYPFCNVAEFSPVLSRPGRAGSTFVYAHAREGMFLAILEASRRDEGRVLLGMSVEVFTSDARRFSYDVVDVQRHVTDLEPVLRATREQLVLQTSEGPRGTVGRTVLIALPVGESAATHREAVPSARPVVCR